MNEVNTFKRALVSVSLKDHLDVFLKPFYDKGMEIIATQGSFQFLKSKGFKVTQVEEITDFPEVLGGRLKTLHPHIHAGLLSREGYEEDEAFLKQKNLKKFDLVVVNLYPFEETLKKTKHESQLIENIDIGGATLLRAAAKNYERITVVCDYRDYKRIKRKPNLKERKKLSVKVFQKLSHYDKAISNYLKSEKNSEVNLHFEEIRELRYGENPGQKALWLKKQNISQGLHKAELLQGKPLSYNNLLDLNAAILTLREFLYSHGCVVVKHLNPCGIAIGDTLEKASQKAFQADPVSAFGGVVALNGEISVPIARQLNSLFLECIIAPHIFDEAKVFLAQKKNLRVLEWKGLMEKPVKEMEFRSIEGGALLQSSIKSIDWDDTTFELIGEWEKIPSLLTKSLKNDLLLALKVCAHLKSNAISLVSQGQTVGLGMGQVNRVDSVRQAILRKNSLHPNLKTPVVLASDGFFPFTDSLELALKENIMYIIQPGGSLKDSKVKSFIRAKKMNMILTKKRYFLH